MSQCSSWSACSHAVFSESTQASTQRHRLEPSSIPRHPTDLRALLGCSAHINDGFQPTTACWGHVEAALRFSLFFCSTSSSCTCLSACLTLTISTASCSTHTKSPSIPHHSWHAAQLVQLPVAQVRSTPKPAHFSKWGKEKSQGRETKLIFAL